MFAGAIALAVGFAAQDLLANFVSGIFILKDRPFEVGDWIEVNDITGRVEDIDLRTSTMTVRAGTPLQVVQEQGLDIFTNCSGCTATLSETYHMLDNAPMLHQTSSLVSAHIMQGLSVA